MADGDARACLRVGHAEPGEIAPHGGVQLHLARLDELHHRRGGQRLAHRGYDEGCLGRHGAALLVRLAEALRVYDLIALDYAERHTW